uniref:Ig-like domain-containing protein n=1 Tax=Oncorhynchus kisutch TaxID=8019 RepID=A0A8C7JCH9_ONCKI
MRCDIQGGGDTDWNYRWYKNSPVGILFNTKPEYRISPVYWSNSGSYTCEGVKGSKLSMTSDAVQLTVSDQPKAVLSIFPQWMNPGDSVMLSCEVDKTSTDWRFSWYRTVPYRAGLPSLSDKSYSLQPLSDNVTTEDSYTLIPAGPTPTGGYVCRAGRGDPVYDTLYSEPQFLWSGDLQPSVSLTVNPNTTQHFTSTSLSLSCEEKGNSTGWRLMSYRERRVKSGCVSNWGSIAGSTCTIIYTYTWYSGVFWCESGSGEYSNAVNITVNDGDVILESPVHPVTERDSVTLCCKYWTLKSNFKADFYKNGVLIKNETTGEMTIPTVSKSDEGFYKCKSGEGESPESWVTVREKLADPVYSVVKIGKATAAGPDDVTYAEVDLKNKAKAKKKRGAASVDVTYAEVDLQRKAKAKKKIETATPPETDSVYSLVKPYTVPAARPVDVTYAEVDLQKKNKAKKKRVTPPEADTIYSRLKPR